TTSWQGALPTVRGAARATSKRVPSFRSLSNRLLGTLRSSIFVRRAPMASRSSMPRAQAIRWAVPKVLIRTGTSEPSTRSNSSATLGYTMPAVIGTEDATVLESMGPIVDRENEHPLPTGDGGIMALRDVYLREIEAVKAGRDPKGTVRDAVQNELIVIHPQYWP